MTRHPNRNKLAEANVVGLGKVPHLRMGLVMGLNQSGDQVHQLYLQAGRLYEARAKRLEIVGPRAGKIVRTVVYGPGDVALRSYDTMVSQQSNPGQVHHIVTSGAAASRMAKAYEFGQGGLGRMKHLLQPVDGTTPVPQLTGVVNIGPHKSDFINRNLVMANLFAQTAVDDIRDVRWPFIRNLRESSEPGSGYGIYASDADANAAVGTYRSPLILPIGETIDDTLDIYQHALSSRYLVNIAVKSIDLTRDYAVELRVMNKVEA